MHVSRRSDGSTQIKGMREYDPRPPMPEDIEAEEFDRFAALMAEPPEGVMREPEWMPYLLEDD